MEIRQVMFSFCKHIIPSKTASPRALGVAHIPVLWVLTVLVVTFSLPTPSWGGHCIPSIEFVSDTDIFAGETVTFVASGRDRVSGALCTGHPITAVWDFDGGVGDSTSFNPTVRFGGAGTYEVTFQISDFEVGLSTIGRRAVITVRDKPASRTVTVNKTDTGDGK